MRQVYAPANSAEAHMLVHLLDQAGIVAHIHGEALQSSVGELPAMALLQIQVADEDYDAARKLILDWERKQPEAAPEAAPTKVRFPVLALALTLAIGVAAGWLLKDRVTALPIDAAEVTFDDNGDGAPDGRFFYHVGGSNAYKLEDDNNFDGVIDDRVRFNDHGAATRQELDQDFDGFFETTVLFEDNNVSRWDIDTDKNGVADIVMHYRLGVVRRVEYRDSSVGQIARIEYFNDFRMTQSEHDLNRDGFTETERHYDDFGEVVRSEIRARPR